MKKYIAGIILVLVIGVVAFKAIKSRRSAEVNPQTLVGQVDSFTLPQGWERVSDSKVMYKLVKNVNETVKPEIAVIQSVSKEASASAAYVDRLIAGARSTVSGLQFVENKRTEIGGVYEAQLEGYYPNQKIKVKVMQRVYIKGETVYTMTASFIGDVKNEVNLIFDYIAKDKLVW